MMPGSSSEYIAGSRYANFSLEQERAINETYFVLFIGSSNPLNSSQASADTIRNTDPFSDPDEYDIPILQTKSIKAQG